MKISIEIIKEYLVLVNDMNPIHNDIVPGQLVCEIAFEELNIQNINVVDGQEAKNRCSYRYW